MVGLAQKKIKIGDESFSIPKPEPNFGQNVNPNFNQEIFETEWLIETLGMNGCQSTKSA